VLQTAPIMLRVVYGGPKRCRDAHGAC